MTIGLFDPSALPQGWFAEEAQPAGWFDAILLDQAGATATITGTLAATDVSDAAVFSGDVCHVGSLIATDGEDTAAFSGAIAHTGTLTVTDGEDTASFVGDNCHVGDLAAQDSSDSFISVGEVIGVEGDVYSGAGYPIRIHKKKPYIRIDDIVERSMRELYEGITETAPQQVKKQAAKIVRPHIVVGVKPATIPPASIIDWATLERDAARVSALLALWQEQMESLEDEEMLLMLMAA